MAGQNAKGLKGAVTRHFERNIWTKEAESANGARKGVFAVSRLIYMVSTGFLADHCIIRASALTFTTILSIVPLLAVAFSISKGFGLQNAEFFRNFLMGIAADRVDVVNKILQYIANTNVKTLGWIGVGTLLLTVYTTVSNVERAFNNIWNVKKGRSSWRKFTDFFSVIVICPIIVLVAASVSVAVQKLDLVQDFFAEPGSESLEKFLLKCLSLVLVWVGFIFVYAFVPNTRVRLRSAVAGGLVAGTLWQSAQWLYIHWQIGFTKYSAIYGSFAQLPLFLVWLYISWVIVLLGAEVSYAVQHLGGFVRLGLSERLSPLARQKVAVAALTHIAARFAAGLSPLPVRELSKTLHLPEDSLETAKDDEDSWYEDELVGRLCLVGGLLRSELHRANVGMGVTRSHRRQRGGSLLLATAIGWARRQLLIDWIDLSVFSDNPDAEALYARHGFQVVGRTPDRFRLHGRSLDDIAMTLHLARPGSDDVYGHGPHDK